jgi:hypothetical protein
MAKLLNSGRVCSVSGTHQLLGHSHCFGSSALQVENLGARLRLDRQPPGTRAQTTVHQQVTRGQ